MFYGMVGVLFDKHLTTKTRVSHPGTSFRVGQGMYRVRHLPIFGGRFTQHRMFMFLNQFVAVQSQCSFRSPANYEITPTEDKRWRTLY